jgi:hypothetical protein
MQIVRRGTRGEYHACEEKTEQTLRPLEQAGWSVVHELRARYGNYAHVAVGPSGVYLLETKQQEGIVDIRCGAPRRGRRRGESEASVVFPRYRPRVPGVARRVEEQIQKHSGQRAAVQAVVVFWSEFPERLVEDGRCVYIHGSALRDWMGARERRLDEDQVERIAGAIERLHGQRVAASVS